MKRHIVYACTGCIALLLFWGMSISRSLAQEGAGERETLAPDEVSAMSDYIPIQGRLTDPSGNPLDGNYNVSLRIYSSYTGGAPLCQDPDNNVMVDNGFFLTYMNMANCHAFDGRQLYLGIQVGSDPEMEPRQYIDNVPYAWGLRPGAVISSTMDSNAILHIENRGSGGGVEGFSIDGPGVYGESLSGAAIAANGAITSTAPTYLWISGNDVVRYTQNDTTIINLMSNGGSVLEQGASAATKYMVLPVTIAGTLYGQNVRLTALDIYWQGETSMDALVDMRLRRQTGACWTCYLEMMHDAADYICDDDDNPTGCTRHYDLTVNNVLNPDSGNLYLMVGFNFSGPSTEIRLGGARLTLEYDE